MNVTSVRPGLRESLRFWSQSPRRAVPSRPLDESVGEFLNRPVDSYLAIPVDQCHLRQDTLGRKDHPLIGAMMLEQNDEWSLFDLAGSVGSAKAVAGVRDLRVRNRQQAVLRLRRVMGTTRPRPCENTLEHCSDEMSTNQIRPGSTIVLLVGVRRTPEILRRRSFHTASTRGCVQTRWAAQSRALWLTLLNEYVEAKGLRPYALIAAISLPVPRILIARFRL